MKFLLKKCYKNTIFYSGLIYLTYYCCLHSKLDHACLKIHGDTHFQNQCTPPTPPTTITILSPLHPPPPHPHPTPPKIIMIIKRGTLQSSLWLLTGWCNALCRPTNTPLGWVSDGQCLGLICVYVYGTVTRFTCMGMRAVNNDVEYQLWARRVVYIYIYIYIYTYIW